MNSPGSLDRCKRQRIQELESTFIKCLKELKFKQALRTAESILALDGGNERIKEFVPVLTEKIALDEAQSDSDDSDSIPAAGQANSKIDDQGEDGSGNSEDDSDEESDEGTSDDSTTDGEDQGDSNDEHEDNKQQSDHIPAYVPNREQGVNLAVEDASQQQHITRITLDTRNTQLTAEQRRRIRDDLARSIAGLKAQELAQQLAASNPLLGA